MTEPGKGAEKIVSVSRVVAADPSDIFELLAQPTRHHEIDGSGMIQSTGADAPDRLSLGATFGMEMKFLGFLPYRITNTVVEFIENERIAWRHFGRHIWRYELTPQDGATLVTESFEWGTAPIPKYYELVNYPSINKGYIEATLERLAEVFGG